MSEKRFETVEQYENLFVIRKGNKTYNLVKVCDLLNELSDKNGQLKETNEKLQWELDKTREDLNYFANLKITAIGGEPK